MKRQEAKDRLRSESDSRVNLKAELEIRHLHEKMDHLISRSVAASRGNSTDADRDHPRVEPRGDREEIQSDLNGQTMLRCETCSPERNCQ
jgi:uncharacterized membrane protein